MSVAKVLELSADSTSGFEDAVSVGLRKASESVSGIRSAWIENQEVIVEDGAVSRYRVHMRVTFVVK